MRFLKANRLFDGKCFLPDSSVLVIDSEDNLVEISDESILPADKIEYFEGIITPGFINAHCHLELSHLKHKIKKHTGIPEFGKQIISQRATIYNKEEAEQASSAADIEMWESGIVAVGDISNNNDSFKTKQNSKIFYHTFVEVLGLNPVNQQVAFDYGLSILKQLQLLNLSGSIVPHAPYSSSLDLIKSTVEFDKKNNLPFCIHNQETEEETKFFLGQPSEFKKLYEFLNLDISWFKAPLKSSLASYVELLGQLKAILVHNTFSNKNDIELATSKGCFFCFCPNANLYIENRLPQFNLFKNSLSNLCIGTDSLASNNALDIISEANIILNSSVFTLQNVLQMLTYNCAEALNLSEKYGRYIIGKNVGLNLLHFQKNQLTFVKKLT